MARHTLKGDKSESAGPGQKGSCHEADRRTLNGSRTTKWAQRPPDANAKGEGKSHAQGNPPTLPSTSPPGATEPMHRQGRVKATRNQARPGAKSKHKAKPSDNTTGSGQRHKLPQPCGPSTNSGQRQNPYKGCQAAADLTSFPSTKSVARLN